MKVKDICSYIDKVVPVSFQESYDNSGLQAGDPDRVIESALLAIDMTEEVLEEAIEKSCGLIITHHPLLFHPLKQITGKTLSERIIIKAVRNNISIYSVHTNLDVVWNGVSFKMAEKLSLEEVRPLIYLKNRLLKLITYVPPSHIEKVRDAVFSAGAGVIGNYDSCSFNVEGTGTFRGNEKSDPFVGEAGKLHFEKEVRFETVLLSHLKDVVIEALLGSHPYEEVAYDLYPLENEYLMAGSGCIGTLPEQTSEKDFLDILSDVFNSRGVRYSKLLNKKIQKVALCGGAGIGFLGEAIRSGADAFVTGDIKYHDFFRADGRILLVDIGHYESEKFTTEILYHLITKKFPKFALRFSERNTNPINYL
jgi:dinuclear metal center YbgI/SA1388 family protein